MRWAETDRRAVIGQTGDVTPACRAALDVARGLGLAVNDAELVQETNNTVVWLRPHGVIAKVGTHGNSAEGLIREHAIGVALAALGAPVAPPLPDVKPVRHGPTGFTVTLWSRLDHQCDDIHIPGSMVGESLRVLHQALSICGVELPGFRVALDAARNALSDDARVAALASAERVALRAAFDDLMGELDHRDFCEQALHGEPHEGNRLSTPAGLRWIDLESVCRGPLEWDLALLPAGAREVFSVVDPDLLRLLQVLNSARVATWCWVQARFPEMRRHGEHHLSIVLSGMGYCG